MSLVMKRSLKFNKLFGNHIWQTYNGICTCKLNAINSNVYYHEKNRNIINNISFLKSFQRGVFTWNPFLEKSFGNYAKILKPGEISEQKVVPPDIPLPPYAISGCPSKPLSIPEIKNPRQINGMRKACYLARKVMNVVGEKLCVGMSTDDIDNLVHETSLQNKSYPSTLNYKGFPKSVCTSVNNVACHGIPDDRCLQDGDIISVDITVRFLRIYII